MNRYLIALTVVSSGETEYVHGAGSDPQEAARRASEFWGDEFKVTRVYQLALNLED